MKYTGGQSCNTGGGASRELRVEMECGGIGDAREGKGNDKEGTVVGTVVRVEETERERDRRDVEARFLLFERARALEPVAQVAARQQVADEVAVVLVLKRAVQCAYPAARAPTAPTRARARGRGERAR